VSDRVSSKVVVIGGGSSYTPEIVEGLLARAEELSLREVWLVDIPDGREKLEVVGSLAERMVGRAGNPFEVKLTLDRREALPDADYVVTHHGAGRVRQGAAYGPRDPRYLPRYGGAVPKRVADQLHESERDRDRGGDAAQQDEGRGAVQQRDRHGKLDREGV